MSKRAQPIDLLDRFIFDDLPIRGERVRLEHIWQELRERREYPDNVAEQLAELVATTMLLAVTIKIEGRLTVQIEATGALDMMVVQVNAEKGVRAAARFDENVEGFSALSGLKELCNEGRIVITIDAPTFKNPYQGVIPLQEESIAKAIEYYFETSEQLETRLILRQSGGIISGMMLQRLPGEMVDEDAFNRVSLIANTVTADELGTLDAAVILGRLYPEDDVRVFEPDAFHYACTCSRERSHGLLYQLEPSEIRQILDEEGGSLYVDCEFCGQRYLFEESDIDFDYLEERKVARDQEAATIESDEYH